MARNNIKYSKLEENGEEFGGPVEHIPSAQDIAFSDPRFVSDNVKEAMLEITGNFSYKKLVSGKTVVIPTEQQMRVYQEIEIKGELQVYGDLIVKRG